MRRCLVFIIVLAVSACGGAPPLADTHPSASSLAQAVLDRLGSSDRAGLERLALNEREFRDHVWPQLPASRPERNLPFSYVWGDLRHKSDVSLSKTLAEHGHRRYEFVDLAFDGRTDYETYTVHREATFRVRGSDGTVTTLRVCGSMIEKHGTWKVFSYVVD